MKLQLRNIIDNNTSVHDPALLTEHGLSFFLEKDNTRFLYDVGASDKFVFNAERMGISLSEIDTLVLSHGHRDHTGGLDAFLSVNKHASVYASASIAQDSYYSLRHEKKRDISTDRALLSESKQFVPILCNRFLTPHVAIVYNACSDHPMPKANAFLSVKDSAGERLDNFEHEVSLCIKEPKGLVVLSACSHNGVLNILDSCCKTMQDNRVLAFIGGAHLLDGYEALSDLNYFTQTIKTNYPEMRLVTGHCTGEQSFQTLKDYLGDQLQLFYSGWEL